MDLKSPRNDPYSSKAKILESLKEKGYREIFRVLNEKILEDDDKNQYLNDELIIDEIFRHHIDHKGFNKPVDSNEDVEFYALNAKNGKKGYVERNAADQRVDVVDSFLQNVDRYDELHKNYQ